MYVNEIKPEWEVLQLHGVLSSPFVGYKVLNYSVKYYFMMIL